MTYSLVESTDRGKYIVGQSNAGKACYTDVVLLLVRGWVYVFAYCDLL
jgi:hypothetical protein